MLKVLNEISPEPFHSARSISGGHELTAVSQNAGQVPFATGAWKSPMKS